MQREVISFFRLTEIIRRKNQAGCWVHKPSSRPEIEAEVCKTECQWRTIALSVTSCVNQFCFPCAKEPHHSTVKTRCPEATPVPGATAVAEGARLPRGSELGHHPTWASRCPESMRASLTPLHPVPHPSPGNTVPPCAPGPCLTLGTL